MKRKEKVRETGDWKTVQKNTVPYSSIDNVGKQSFLTVKNVSGRALLGKGKAILLNLICQSILTCREMRRGKDFK